MVLWGTTWWRQASGRVSGCAEGYINGSVESREWPPNVNCGKSAGCISNGCGGIIIVAAGTY